MSSGKQTSDRESDRLLIDVEQGHAEQEAPSCSLETPSECSLACIWSEIV